jgi:hypothetical protein
MVSDYQMITASSYSAGSTATTYGKVYAAGTITHDGTALANLYSEASTPGGATTLGTGVLRIGPATTPKIRDVPGLASPINFANFQNSLDDVKRASQVSGIYLDGTYAAWKIVFNSGGTVTYTGCSTGGNNPGQTQPTCSGTTATVNMPTNGAIYVETVAIIGWSTGTSSVNGRVTVASNSDVVIGGNIEYASAPGNTNWSTIVGDDVLGAMAKQNVYVAKWCPSTISWRAAVIAQNGQRSSWDSSGTKTLATHIGMTASYLHPFMDMFATREYYYDYALQYLPPPWFPALDDAYEVDLFREVSP